GGLNEPRHRDSPAVEAEWRKQIPLHLSGQAELLSPSDRGVRVGALAARDEEGGHDTGQAVTECAAVVVELAQGDAHDAEAGRTVDDDAPQSHAVFESLAQLGCGG